MNRFHSMRIHRGQICFHFANSPELCSEFNTEREASEALVRSMMNTGVTEVELDSSVYYPELHDRCEFLYSVFHDRIQQVLDRLHEIGSR